MTIIAPDISCFDLEFQGLRRIIATAFLHGSDGIAIVDPGPSTTLPVLRRHLEASGGSIADVSALLVTHIHLDHAGAAGTLVRENRRIKVYVHEVGAPHLADPAKLLASAGRLYGDRMQELWGEVLPVPAEAIVALKGGDRVDAGRRSWEVAYTPGHASHHVSYFSPDVGLAFVGDTAGIQVTRGGFVLPPTPPPDIDIPKWLESLAAIERWHPRSLFLTHFGLVDEVPTHLADVRDHLELFDRLAREAMTRIADPAGQESWFVEQVRARVAQRLGHADLQSYELAGRFDLNWKGLERYVRKKLTT